MATLSSIITPSNVETATSTSTLTNKTWNSNTIGVAYGGTGATSLTANNVLLGNGTSAVQVVAPGASGNVLTSNGTTWQSTALAAGGSWTYLSTVTASSSSTVDVETTFNSTYDVYALIVTAVIPSVDNEEFKVRLKIGGTYVGTSDYQFRTSQLTSNGTLYDATSGNANDEIVLRQIGNAASKGGHFKILIFNPASTTQQKMITYEGVVARSGGDTLSISGAGARKSTGAMTGVRFFFASGTVTSGTFRLYGIKNS